MSNFVAQSFRINDEKLVRLRFYPDIVKCEKMVMQITNNNVPIEILSTSAGAIDRNGIHIRGVPNFIELFIKQSNVPTYECIVSYLNGEALMQSASYSATVSEIGHIAPIITEINVVRSLGQDFINRMNYFISNLTKYKSSWKVRVEATDDVILTVLSRGLQKTYLAFGESSVEILKSDFIFTIEPKLNSLIIPIEIIWNLFDDYKKESLACFELVKPDFHSIPNVYYKVQISNELRLQSIRRKPMRNLSEFKTPFGNSFAPSDWIISDKTGLPRVK